MTAHANYSDRRRRRASYVSATELAEMGFCEKRVLLAHLHGKQIPAWQRESLRRGRVAHQQYHEQGLATPSSDKRCFIATCVFGESARETRVLRDFRDTVLLTHWWGRLIVDVYYRIAPTACVALRRSPALMKVTRVLLAFVVHRQRGAAVWSEE